MRRILLTLLALTALVGSGLGLTAPASAATRTIVLDESVAAADVAFIPSGNPADPRGPGSVLISTGTLTENGRAVGTVYVVCTTSRQVGGDFYGVCEQTVVINGKGAIRAEGEINETALERFEPQTLTVVSGTGAFTGASGTLTVQQTRFPDQFRLTISLR